MLKKLIASMAVAGLLAACGGRSKARAHYPGAPVIIISIDTLRADHLPMYGYKDVETPNLSALRNDSILFTNAFSSVPLTFPSHTSMLTGLLPPDSHVRNNIGYSLDPTLPTIPKALKSKGYDTGGAISAYVLRGNIGLASSFDFYDDGIVSKAGVPVGTLQRSGFDTASVAKRWIGEHEQKPFFFFLHLFEPHSPYTPPEPYKSRYRLPYDGEIATADAIVGDFLAQLKRDGVYEKAVIILMSDHGEGLMQHGEPEHGIFLYREALHVPLMVKLPGSARGGETDSSAVGLIDIFPTIAELTDAPAPKNLAGQSLLHHQPADASRRIYSETFYPRIHLGWSELRSLEGADYHFIQAPKPELYDMTHDPGETHNVLTEERRVYSSMRDQLGTYGTEIETPAKVDPEEAKKLAALGYLGSSAAPSNGPLPDPKDRIGEVADMVAAMRLVNEGKDAQAVNAFRAILAKNPGLTDAWNQLGSSLETLARFDEAVECYRKAITITPTLAGEFGLRLASVLLKLDRLDEAEQHARLGEKVNFGGSHVLLARIALARKDFATAEKESRTAATDQYSRVPAMVLLAQILAQENRAQEAYAIVQQVTQEQSERKLGPVETLEFVRGDCLARMQRYDEAIAAFQREIELFPHNRQSYASLYVVDLLTNRQSEARAALDLMVRNNPNKRAALFAAHTAAATHDTQTEAFWNGRAAQLR